MFHIFKNEETYLSRRKSVREVIINNLKDPFGECRTLYVNIYFSCAGTVDSRERSCIIYTANFRDVNLFLNITLEFLEKS